MNLPKPPPTSEGDLKGAAKGLLTVLEKRGKLIFLRLNAGMLIAENKEGKRRAIKLSPPGTADYLVLRARRIMVLGRMAEEVLPTCEITFIELKAPGKKQTPAQKAFQSRVEAQGAEYWLIDDYDELERRLGK